MKTLLKMKMVCKLTPLLLPHLSNLPVAYPPTLPLTLKTRRKKMNLLPLLIFILLPLNLKSLTKMTILLKDWSRMESCYRPHRLVRHC